MQCPKCDGSLNADRTFTTIRYDQCDDCGGIMMTPDMVRKAKQMIRPQDFIERGSPRRGKELNRVEDIDCPFCDSHPRMEKIQDPGQSHIWLEQCPDCERLFFDAGEFEDSVVENLWDKVLDRIRPLRE